VRKAGRTCTISWNILLMLALTRTRDQTEIQRMFQEY
jgi:L-asparaginase/Glu-tRNA(Gln) amidotransferase subunit D